MYPTKYFHLLLLYEAENGGDIGEGEMVGNRVDNDFHVLSIV